MTASFDAHTRTISLQEGDAIVARSSRSKQDRVSDTDNLYFDNGHVSKNHAKFGYADGRIYLEDEGSTFGTIWNNHLLAPNHRVLISQGDRVGFVINRAASVVVEWRNRFPTSNLIPLDRLLNPHLQLNFVISDLDLDQKIFTITPIDTQTANACSKVVEEDARTVTPVNDSLGTWGVVDEEDVKLEASEADLGTESDAPEEVKFVKEVFANDDSITVDDADNQDGPHSDDYPAEVSETTTETTLSSKPGHAEEESDGQEYKPKSASVVDSSSEAEDEFPKEVYLFDSDYDSQDDQTFEHNEQPIAASDNDFDDNSENLDLESGDELIVHQKPILLFYQELADDGQETESESNFTSDGCVSYLISEDESKDEGNEGVYQDPLGEKASIPWCGTKRKFDETDFDEDDDEDYDPEHENKSDSQEPPAKKAKSSTTRTILKEIGKGALYVTGTLLAMIIYGSKLENERS